MIKTLLVEEFGQATVDECKAVITRKLKESFSVPGSGLAAWPTRREIATAGGFKRGMYAIPDECAYAEGAPVGADDPYGAVDGYSEIGGFVDERDLGSALGSGADDAEIRLLLKEKEDSTMLTDGTAHITATVVDFEKDATGRNRHTLRLAYGPTTWELKRYYTDFAALSARLLATNGLQKYADGLPEKHSVQLAMKMKMSSAATKAKLESAFMANRMDGLQKWLDNFLGSLTLADVIGHAFLDEWLEVYWNVNLSA